MQVLQADSFFIFKVSSKVLPSELLLHSVHILSSVIHSTPAALDWRFQRQ